MNEPYQFGFGCFAFDMFVTTNITKVDLRVKVVKVLFINQIRLMKY